MGIQTGAGLLSYCVLCLSETFAFSLFITKVGLLSVPLFFTIPFRVLYKESTDSEVQLSVVDRVKQSTFPESN